MKERSRDLWSKTKAPLAEGKRKSRELVDLSADLISSLSIRVQKWHHSAHRQQESSSSRKSLALVFPVLSVSCLLLTSLPHECPPTESDLIQLT